MYKMHTTIDFFYLLFIFQRQTISHARDKQLIFSTGKPTIHPLRGQLPTQTQRHQESPSSPKPDHFFDNSTKDNVSENPYSDAFKFIK